MTEKVFDYTPLDTIKRLGQQSAAFSGENMQRMGFKELPESRGETAFIFDMGPWYGAVVAEDLGTKNLIADEFDPLAEHQYYDKLAQDTVAMITNDLITVGALPLTVSPLWVSGGTNWFENDQRAHDLVTGWARAVAATGASYAGGETAAFGGIVYPDKILLAGSGFGVIPKERLTLGEKLTAGDRIILIESNGIHANGLTLARKIASELPHKYQTELPSGSALGDALLKPTHLYAPFVDALFQNGVDVHYLSNITGHGWKKIMRAKPEFTYRLDHLPQPQEELVFLQQQGQITDEDAYSVWDMGSGFVVFVPMSETFAVHRLASEAGFNSLDAGVLEAGPKQVIVTPKNIVYTDLQIR